MSSPPSSAMTATGAVGWTTTPTSPAPSAWTWPTTMASKSRGERSRLPPISGQAKSRIPRILFPRRPDHPGSRSPLPSEVDAVIAHLQRASHTASLLEYLYGPGERGNHTNPHLIAGDGHGAPIEMLAQSDAPTYLAH